ncbi:MAG TPA: diheme cytochrome c-553 [Cyclobacteriaceae bacterium]|nr:diheme cytochrome c-553 [Cyclobacteriaceae bacterium]HRJ83618.1 diheme cytochrome c-553 [Cyclobacteriaceae bacterium]
MKTITLTSVIALLSITGCMFRTPEKATEVNFADQELIKRGQHLVTVSACHDCHSPKLMTPEGPIPDPDRLLSGHPQDEKLPEIPAGSQEWILFSAGLTGFVGPWGVSYAANLTPDDTGIGNWSFEQFELAIRKGKYKGLEGSRSLLPPMPWEMYRNFSDDELKAIFAYLKSIKPVNNLVPAPIAPNDLSTLISLN